MAKFNEGNFGQLLQKFRLHNNIRSKYYTRLMQFGIKSVNIPCVDPIMNQFPFSSAISGFSLHNKSHYIAYAENFEISSSILPQIWDNYPHIL